MTRLRVCASMLVVSCLGIGSAAAAQPVGEPAADVIYLGGDIVTVDELQPVAEAVAVANGEIVAVGYRDDVMRYRGDATRVVDLGGRTMVPGFVDGHGHVFNAGIQAMSANLLAPPDGDVRDVAGLQSTLTEWAAANPDVVGQLGWIVGFGYDDAQLAEGRHPLREELDAVSAEVPVIIVHQSSHLGVINGAGMTLAGIDAASEDPPGGAIRRKDGSREPNGVLEETALFAVLLKIFGSLSAEDNQAVLAAGVDLFCRYGYTTAQEGRASAAAVATMAAVARAGELPIDVVAYPDIVTAAAAIEPSRQYRGRFRIGGAKLNLDGSPQGKTAWLTEPYFVPPAGQGPDYRGYPTMSDAEATALVDLAFANGWQLLTHVNGDAAIDQLIAAVRAAEEKYGRSDRRPVAIHAQTARRDQLASFQQLGIMPSFFPMHTFYWGDWHRDSVLGPKRAADISPTGWALARGMIFTSHHDAPVALPDSMRVLSATVNRVTRSGQILGPEQRVSPLVGLKAMTLWAAWQYFEEDRKGSIEVGKVADFAILDRNPLTVEPMQIADIEVVETIKEGRTVCRSEAAVGVRREPTAGPRK